MFTFAVQKMQEILAALTPREITELANGHTWSSVPGIEFTTLDPGLLGMNFQKENGVILEKLEFELFRVLSNVPLHTHARSAGFMRVFPLPSNTAATLYLGYTRSHGEWITIDKNGCFIALEEGCVHGFRITGGPMTIFSINFPPLAPDDTTYI